MKNELSTLALVLVAAAFHGGPVRADCICDVYTAYALSPLAGTTVPSDGLIWLYQDDIEDEDGIFVREVPTGAHLRASGAGTLVSGFIHPLGGRRAVFEPDEALSPAETYSVLLEFAEREPVQVGVIEVALAPAEPATIPVAARVETEAAVNALPGFPNWLFSYPCPAGPYVAMAMTVQPGNVLNVLADASDPPDLSTPWSSGTRARSYTDELRLQSGTNCSSFGDAPPPLSRATYVVGSFNAAGQFSGWSEPIPVQYPAPGCSCSASGAPGPHVPWFGFGAVLVLLRIVRRPIENSR